MMIQFDYGESLFQQKEADKMNEAEKRVVVPMVNINHNDDDTGLIIKVDLAGASKNSVDLDMGEKGFCIRLL